MLKFAMVSNDLDSSDSDDSVVERAAQSHLKLHSKEKKVNLLKKRAEIGFLKR